MVLLMAVEARTVMEPSLLPELICIFYGFHQGRLKCNSLSDKFKSEQFPQSCETWKDKVRSGLEAWKSKAPIMFVCIFLQWAAQGRHPDRRLVLGLITRASRTCCWKALFTTSTSRGATRPTTATCTITSSTRWAAQGNTRPCSPINRNCLTAHNSRFLNRRSIGAWNVSWNDWCWSWWYNKSPLRPNLYKTAF